MKPPNLAFVVVAQCEWPDLRPVPFHPRSPHGIDEREDITTDYAAVQVFVRFHRFAQNYTGRTPNILPYIAEAYPIYLANTGRRLS